MALFKFMDKGFKIQAAKNGDVNEFIFTYPIKNGVHVEVGTEIMTSLLKNDNVFIHVDSSLSFADNIDVKGSFKELKSSLESLSIYYEYRSTKGDNANRSFLSTLSLFGRKPDNREIIVFELPQNFKDIEIFKILLDLGCQIYAPYEASYSPELLHKIFNGHFDDGDDKYDKFKYISYINNVLKQGILRSTGLQTPDVEKIFIDIK